MSISCLILLNHIHYFLIFLILQAHLNLPSSLLEPHTSFLSCGSLSLSSYPNDHGMNEAANDLSMIKKKKKEKKLKTELYDFGLCDFHKVN